MSISLRTRFRVLTRDGFRCQYCGVRAGDAELVVDHVVPKSKHGPDDEWNLLTACNDCNAGKSALDDDYVLIHALHIARLREDPHSGFFLFTTLTARGWNKESLLDAASEIYGPPQ